MNIEKHGCLQTSSKVAYCIHILVKVFVFIFEFYIRTYVDAFCLNQSAQYLCLL